MRKRARIKNKVELTLRLGPALRLIWQSAPGWTVLSLALVAVQATLPLLGLYLLKLVVDAVSGGGAASGTGAPFGDTLLLIALVALVGLLVAAGNTLAALASEAQAHLVTDHVLHLLHEKSTQVDLGYYEDPRYYDVLHRAQSEAPFRPQRVLNNLLQVTRSGLTAAGIVLLLLTVHWIVPLLLLAAVVPALFVRLRYTDRIERWKRQRSSTERRALYLDRLLTHAWHAKEVRLFGLGPILMGRFCDLRDRLRGERLRLGRQRALGDMTVQLGASLAILAAFALIAYKTYLGALTVGDLVMYFGAVQKAQALLQMMFVGLGGLYEDNLFLSTLDDFLTLEPQVVPAADPKPVPNPIRAGFELDRVSFRYPTSSRPLLEDVTLAVRPGEMVALIGKNGSGKTTLVKLLCRFYDPSGGAITLDGVDLRVLCPDELRRQITVVFQDFARYQMSARDNIWFGDVHRPPDLGWIAEAATAAGAEDLIRGLRHGYDTILGNWFEAGEELSAGEWQKVALARAFASAAPLMVLDEPTSALDARAEAKVFETVRRLGRDRAVLVISHRFSTVRMADRIYLLDGGRICEHGTHDELIGQGGMYAELFELQAAAYRGDECDASFAAARQGANRRLRVVGAGVNARPQEGVRDDVKRWDAKVGGS